jgi:hypothetical protein
MIFTMPELAFMARIEGCDMARIWDRDVDDIRTTLAVLIDEHDDDPTSVRLPSKLFASTLCDRFDEHDASGGNASPLDRASMGGDHVILDDYVEK